MRRRRWSGLKKIGLLALALVIALGSLGVAYAAWNDKVYLNTTVQTGTVDADICGVSSTFVYKVPNAPDIGYGPETVVDYYYGENEYHPPANSTLVAQATTVNTSVWKDPVTHQVVDIDSATMKFEGVFPGIDFLTDMELDYLGTIPAKISIAQITPVDVTDPNYNPDEAAILQELWNLGETSNHTQGIWLDARVSTDDGATWTDVPDPLGLELQQNDLLHVTMHVLLPQDAKYQHLTLYFSGLVTVVQWNEYQGP